MWITLAMALFAAEDAWLKIVFQTVPLGQTMFLFGCFGVVGFLSWALIQRQNPFHADMVRPVMLVRFGFEITGRLFFFLAIALSTLSAATVILQATPILVVAVAAVLFKEKVGPRRWGAIGLGFLGVLIVVRPGADAFDPMSVLAVIGMIGFAGRDLTSRMAPTTLGMVALGLTGFFALSVAGLAYGVWSGEHWAWPTPHAILQIIGITGLGMAAYIALMRA
ncbi:MAG: DMT family transporter, partial [Pseudomonadota bacterium]